MMSVDGYSGGQVPWTWNKAPEQACLGEKEQGGDWQRIAWMQVRVSFKEIRDDGRVFRSSQCGISMMRKGLRLDQVKDTRSVWGCDLQQERGPQLLLASEMK